MKEFGKINDKMKQLGANILSAEHESDICGLKSTVAFHGNNTTDIIISFDKCLLNLEMLMM